MSLDYSVLLKMRISRKLRKSIDNYLLIQNGFYKDSHCYLAGNQRKFIEVYPVENPEGEEFWQDSEALKKKIGFLPQAEIVFSSRHTKSSHRASLRFALELAEIIHGLVYNYQDGNILPMKGKKSIKSEGKVKHEKKRHHEFNNPIHSIPEG